MMCNPNAGIFGVVAREGVRSKNKIFTKFSSKTIECLITYFRVTFGCVEEVELVLVCRLRFKFDPSLLDWRFQVCIFKFETEQLDEPVGI